MIIVNTTNFEISKIIPEIKSIIFLSKGPVICIAKIFTFSFTKRNIKSFTALKCTFRVTLKLDRETNKQMNTPRQTCHLFAVAQPGRRQAAVAGERSPFPTSVINVNLCSKTNQDCTCYTNFHVFFMPKYAFAAGAPPRLRWGANSAP